MAMANRRGGRSRSPPAAASSSGKAAAAMTPSPSFPPDLLREIASRLTSLQDFFALRPLCRAALPLSPPNLASQAPLLLVPDAATASHALFHIRRGFLRFRLTRTHLTGEAADIHSLGCRVAVDLRDRCQLRIVHVLTGERTRLPSPPNPFSGLRLSGDLVVALNHLNLQYCRLGTPKWCVASVSDPCRLHDLIFVDGTLYALVNPGYRLAVVRLSDSGNSNSEELELEFLGGELDAQTFGQSLVFCLAECCGELILVTRPKHNYRRTFHVFRWQSEEQKWERITSLGGCAVFLANYRFAGCLGPDHRGIRGDCIYHTIPGLLRVHSLVDESVTECIINYPVGKVPMEFCQSVWIFPSMC
ncbi:unnamed protein product [Urochloa decumbens]|uniref:KIB1-4 beta-propeller domain-containing protein n=1 Tax=Urochloa decumbens TaxID=240449 RepID=A0ABC9BQA5_9POAL